MRDGMTPIIYLGSEVNRLSISCIVGIRFTVVEVIFCSAHAADIFFTIALYVCL